ncbi:type II secretion system protein [Marinobacterium jannaschii]|uniref:type II secretion system protein n=1 Tax=Marinobacterium jannaschii TaxID=64970 RepID=UPI000684CF5C|nr:prepilin-type N-terminal cleavage/methylation domain-containing protein [Marinobacterium jannaschii]
MNKQAGFTIVELVVVIALLGILAAVALPRFINVTDDAHRANVDGSAGSLRSAVSMVRAQAVASGLAGAGNVTLDGNAIAVDANFNPQVAAGTAAACATLWNNLIAADGPRAADDANSEYEAAQAVAGTCTFTYNDFTTSIVTYVQGTGAVTVAHAADVN